MHTAGGVYVYLMFCLTHCLVGGEFEFDLCDRFSRVETFGARTRAWGGGRSGAVAERQALRHTVEDRVATIQTHFILELLLSLGRFAILVWPSIR